MAERRQVAASGSPARRGIATSPRGARSGLPIARPVRRRRPARGAARHGWSYPGTGSASRCAQPSGAGGPLAQPPVRSPVAPSHTERDRRGAGDAGDWHRREHRDFHHRRRRADQAAAVSRRVAARRGHAPQSCGRGGDSVGPLSLLHVSGRKPLARERWPVALRSGDGHRARSAGAGAGACRHPRDLADSRDSAAGRPCVFRAGRHARQSGDGHADLRLLAAALWRRLVRYRPDADGRRSVARDHRRPAAAVPLSRSADRSGLSLSARSEQRHAGTLCLSEPGPTQARGQRVAGVRGSGADCSARHRAVSAADGLHARAVRPPADDPDRAALEGCRRRRQRAHVVDRDGRSWTGDAHRLRQRRQSASGARRRPTPGAGGAGGARGELGAHCRRVAGRECPARSGRGCRRPGAGLRRSPRGAVAERCQSSARRGSRDRPGAR